MSRENYQEQVQRLAARLSEKHGLTLAPTELLDTVAALHNQPTWGALRKSKKSTLRNWLRTRLFGEPTLQHVLSLEELLHQMTPGQLDLGVSPDHKRTLSLEDGWLRRHLLITGQMGVGATTMLESLIAQQILRGGGALILDPWCALRPEVERYVAFAGRTKDYQTLSLETLHAAGAAIADNHRITYLPVPLLENPRTPTLVRDFFDHFWQAAAKRITPQGFGGISFLVLVPHAAALMDRKWEARYEHARAAGLTVVAHSHGLTQLERADPYVAATILENSWTKVFFRQPSAHSLSIAVGCIESTSALSPTARSVREQLISLGMGEMLVSRPGHLDEARCLMLKR